MLTAFLSMLAVSFTSSVRISLADAGDALTALDADLAAGSGLDWVLAQIRNDRDWEPSGVERVELGVGTWFTVESGLRTVGPESTKAEFFIEGRSDIGVSRLSVSFLIRKDPMLETSVACFGGQHEFIDCVIRGKLTIADQLGVVYDPVYNPLDPGRRRWQLGGAPVMGPTRFENPDIDELEKFASTEYIGLPTVEIQRVDPLYTPWWNLDEYLIPGPDRIIINHQGNGNLTLEDQVMEQTLVVILDQGAILRLQNGVYNGGVVLYAPPDHDIRSGPYNYFEIKHPPCDIGLGTNGVHPELGILAPGSEFSIDCAHLQDLFGFFIFHSAYRADKFWGEGQMIFLDKVEELVCDFTFNPDVSANLPGGIGYGGSDRYVTIDWIKESYLP